MKFALPAALLAVLLVSCRTDSGTPASDTTPPIAVYPDPSDLTEAALPEEQDPDYGKNQVLFETNLSDAKYIAGDGYDLRNAKLLTYTAPDPENSTREITAEDAVQMRENGADYWGDFSFDYCIVTKTSGDAVFKNIEECKNALPLKNVLYNGKILRKGDTSDRLAVKNTEAAIRGAKDPANAKQRFRIDFDGKITLEGYARLGSPNADTADETAENIIFTPTSAGYADLPVITPRFDKMIPLEDGSILNTDVPDINLGTLSDNLPKFPHLNEYLKKNKGAVKVTYVIKNLTIQDGTGNYPSYAELADELTE